MQHDIEAQGLVDKRVLRWTAIVQVFPSGGHVDMRAGVSLPATEEVASPLTIAGHCQAYSSLCLFSSSGLRACSASVER